MMSSTPSLHIRRCPCGRTAAVAACGMGSHATSTNHVIGLDLSCSWLRGAIHCNSTLFLLWDLRWLSLTGNDFYGSRMSPRTKLQGAIPVSMGTLTAMYSLDLSDNQFTGSVPPTQGNLCRLSSLALGGINLSLDFEIFARLKNLESLELSQNLTVMLPNNGNCSFPRLNIESNSRKANVINNSITLWAVSRHREMQQQLS
ncbi:hypothetical protein CDL15_Pgr017696 [Punica granatum]|uniref:Uncharacterized protein n=1 Tax=Punica granatum TaxID=22663 RepID=A0A218WYP5_PUNGR|nr:hypothetical protein CDL15_Pgr017696 [Punica granatum]